MPFIPLIAQVTILKFRKAMHELCIILLDAYIVYALKLQTFPYLSDKCEKMCLPTFVDNNVILFK